MDEQLVKRIRAAASDEEAQAIVKQAQLLKGKRFAEYVEFEPEQGFYDRLKRGPIKEDLNPNTQPYIEHILETVNTWNEAFEEFGLPFTCDDGGILDCPPQNKSTIILNSDYIADFLDGEDEGVVHRNQILTACDFISQSIERRYDPKNNFSIIGQHRKFRIFSADRLALEPSLFI